jgi:homoserine kinase type II
MAVYTEVSFDDANLLVSRLGLGRLTSLRGCSSGIENTNYFADTTEGRFVLTLFERLTFEQLPFYLRLMAHLCARGVPVPGPKADESGDILHTVLGKPAAVVDRLPGAPVVMPDAGHCHSVGAMLARMHLAGQDFGMQQANLRGAKWWSETVPVVLPFLDDAQRELMESELRFQQALSVSLVHASLPRGPIHADLFRDNVMFDGERLTGFFDFYFAGVDSFLFDIAVCLNDWCVDLANGRLHEHRAESFLSSYDAVRPLTGNELRLLPAMMRGAALRFWLSRLWDLHLPRDATVLTAHDPTHFERVLRERVTNPWHHVRA